MGGSTMFKWLLATVAGAAITAGAVYVAQHPEVLEAKPRSDVSAPSAPKTVKTTDVKADADLKIAEQADSKSVIDRLVGKPSGDDPKAATGDAPRDKKTVKALIEDKKATADSDAAAKADSDASSEVSAAQDDSLAIVKIDTDTLESDAPFADELVEGSVRPAASERDESAATEQTPDDLPAAMRWTQGEGHGASHAQTAPLIEQILAQAERIENPDLRDQAYLDLVDFSLSRGKFDVAKAAMTKLAQIELRDNARGRIGEAYARAGDSEAAFAMIDEVEIEDFRDFQRLRVIQALIVDPRASNPPAN